MTRSLSAVRVSVVLAVCAVALTATHQTWSVSLVLLAWTMLGITAGYSLSGSV
ncbi:hypothetical protein [Streptosporangium sp. NPDC000396]|uniref:hypothetical protein n=1 Tax=Streptosporangium sp. NPDC000396 TaxID=3366185 RepID=UPI0036BBEB34